MTKEQEVLKDLKKVTLEELDEAIKAVDKQEQEEVIEYFKKHIKYFEEQIKFIEATDCYYYEEELELYQNRVKQFNTVLSMLKEKDKIIDLYIDNIMTHQQVKTIRKMCCPSCKIGEKACTYGGIHRNCIKQYFENKAKELLNK